MITIFLIFIAAAWKHLVINSDWILCSSIIFAAVNKSIAALCLFFFPILEVLQHCYRCCRVTRQSREGGGGAKCWKKKWKKCSWTQIRHLAAAETSYLCCAAALCAALCRTSSGRRLPAPTQILLEDRTRPRWLKLMMKGKRKELKNLISYKNKSYCSSSFCLLHELKTSNHQSTHLSFRVTVGEVERARLRGC